MAMFKSTPTHSRLERQLDLVSTERDELKTRLQSADQALWNQSQELAAAKQAQATASNPPKNLAEVTASLRMVLPSVTASPGFNRLQQATSAKEYADGILDLLQTARWIGYREASEPSRED